MPLLDECMATVVGGELDPAAAGYVYCGMIGICSKLGDYGRASEWTESTLRWCERQSVPAFPGVCRIHRAELKLLHGNLHEAEAEALAACEELPRYNFVSGPGPGVLRDRRGPAPARRLRRGREAYARADEFGRPPEPGRSLLRLAEGKLPAAAGGYPPALDELGDDLCTRVRLLAAQVEIALAGDDARHGGIRVGRARRPRRGVPDARRSARWRRAARGACSSQRGDAAGALSDPAAGAGRLAGARRPDRGRRGRVLLAEVYAATGTRTRRARKRGRHSTRSSRLALGRPRSGPAGCSIELAPTDERPGTGRPERSCSPTSCARPT